MELTMPWSRRAPSPFSDVRPAAAAAAVYGVAVLVWASAGQHLPGGRWFAVHLFTLGVLTNLISALTLHFSQTLLRHQGRPHAGKRLALLNAGALGVLFHLPLDQPLAVALSATAVTVAVFWLYWDLRIIRKTSLPGRFAFAVRTYERACGAFLHGAVLGALLGTGVLPGAWMGGIRLAHLHTMVLGWAGLTLLATLVVFGPTVMRTRMAPGADAVAARWLPRAATGLTIAVLALAVSTGVPGAAGTALRLLAAAGLAVYTAGAAVVCGDVLSAARDAVKSAHAAALTAAAVWFPIALAADVVVVAGAFWRFTDAIGVVLLVAVLAQAVLGSLGFLAPMLRGTIEQRDRLRRRIDTASGLRVAAFNFGIVTLVLGTAMRLPVVGRIGWLLVALVVAVQALLSLAPVPSADRAEA